LKSTVSRHHTAEIGRLILYLLNVQFLTWLRVEMDGPGALEMQTGG
jgi:hypothetical protein